MPQSLQQTGRQIRVFISSTFRDMQEERDILIKRIFPQLRKLCEERAVTWTEVDLRWGITTEQAAEGKVLPLCLQEIHRCRPYFIGLLGGRYGWVPEPDSIPAELLESQPWLKQHLDHSVTELEILHGVFSEETMHGHAYFYFRDPRYLESIPLEKRQDFTAESVEAAEKLEKLKQKIRCARDEHVCELRENYATPKQLGDWILEDFTRLVERLYARDQAPEPLEQEAARHEAHARSRRLAFVGRKDLVQRLNEHALAPGKPLVLTGESGCGKSALLAEWVALWRKAHPDDLVIQHYIGSTPDSAEWQALVRRILGELKRDFAIGADVPLQTDTLRTALGVWTAMVAGSRRVILVLDALNQITDDVTARKLGWLPVAFPANFRVLVSSLPGESLDELHRRGWPELNVPLFSQADIAPAALAYFKLFSKTPPADMVTKLEAVPAARNALYLRAVLDELRQFGKHEELLAKAAAYLAAPDLPALFDSILTRWHDDFGRDADTLELVRKSLCMIACARFGLSELELLEMLGDKETGRLSQRKWLPFFLAAEGALTIRGGLINFGHEYLRTAVQLRWLRFDWSVREWRIAMAKYFASIRLPTDRKLAELPTLLTQLEEWDALRSFFTDAICFMEMCGHPARRYDLLRIWVQLRERFPDIDIYAEGLAYFEGYDLDAEMRQAMLLTMAERVGTFLVEAGDLIRAGPLVEQAVQLRQSMFGREHHSTLTALNNLAVLKGKLGDYMGSQAVAEQALELCRRSLGTADRLTLQVMNNLATALFNLGKHREAKAIFTEAMETRQAIFGDEDLDTLTSMNDLAVLLSDGDAPVPDLVEMHSRILKARDRVLGAQHPDTLNSMHCLASQLIKAGRLSEAHDLVQRVINGRREIFGPDHPDTLFSKSLMANLLACQGRHASAERIYGEVLDAATSTLGSRHPDTLTMAYNLARFQFLTGNYTQADALARQVSEGRQEVLGPLHKDTGQAEALVHDCRREILARHPSDAQEHKDG